MKKLLNSNKKHYIYFILIAILLLLFFLLILIYRNEINSLLTVKASDSIVYDEEDTYSISLVKSSSIQTDKGFQSVYTVSITNIGSTSLNDYLLTLELPIDVKLMQTWYGEFEYKDKFINIKSLSYNKTNDNKYKASCGFTLISKKDFDVKSIKIHFNNNIYTSIN